MLFNYSFYLIFNHRVNGLSYNEISRVIFTEPRVFVESRFQKSADQPNGDSGLPSRSLRSLLAMTRGANWSDLG